MKPVAVIGGGIAGLTAAFRLKQMGHPVVLYEAASRVGGVIETVREDGFLAELGPNSMMDTAPELTELMRALKLDTGEKIAASSVASKRFIVKNRRAVETPSSFRTFLTSPLLSFSAKLRLCCEPFVPRRTEESEESLAEFVRRRLGREALDYGVNPFVGGVYAGDPEKLSVKYAFPRLHALEANYGSLVRGGIRTMRARRKSSPPSAAGTSPHPGPAGKPGGARRSGGPRILSFRSGLQALPEAFHKELWGEIVVNTRVTSIERNASGWKISSRSGDTENTFTYESVLIAVPAHRIPDLGLKGELFSRASALAGIDYPPVAVLALGFRRADIAHPLDGFGVLVPQVEGLNILGTLFSSTLFPDRAPDGHALLTTFLGGARDRSLPLMSPETLVDVVTSDLADLLGVKGKPVWMKHRLYRKAIPQYDLGYGKHLEIATEIEAASPGLYFAGTWRDGIAMPEAVLSGWKAADRIGGFLHGRN
jgi:protoporphyrinogen/coproporphyrinogen III oxidase